MAFSLTNSLTAFGDMSNTTQSWPFPIRRRTMFAPIRPRPTIPNCIMISPLRGGNCPISQFPLSGLSVPGLRRCSRLHLRVRTSMQFDFVVLAFPSAVVQPEKGEPNCCFLFGQQEVHKFD